MKKLLLFAFAVFAFVACTQNDVEELSANRADVPETLTVGFEGGDTRIQLNEAQKTVWTKDDLVSVFYRSNANQKWQYQGETGERVGNLKCLESGVATRDLDNVIVVYPYNENYYINTETYNIDATLPAVQHYAEESYGVGENLMVSCDEDNQISLRNVCGWLKIQLTGNGERVQSITLRGNNEEQLAGLIYVDTATAESTLASEMGSADDNNAGGNLVFDDAIVTELTLDCDEGVVLGAEAISFYFALPPQTFEGGFTVDVECEDSEPMAISTENSVTIQRNHIQPMASIAFEGEEVIPYNEIHYTATAKVKADSDYPWTFDTFGANIVSHEWDSESGEGVITFDADVTTIGERAFYICYRLTSITIPDSVTTIGARAFYLCSSLTSVTIPDSVTTIGEDAFYDCGLKSVTIGDSVTTIGDNAFSWCSSLTSVTIGDSVTTIGERAFSGCDSLTEFNGKIASEDGRCLIVDGTLNSFAPAGLTSYTIPDSVTTIGDYAFCNCDSLTSVTIPDSVTTIEFAAFYNCDSLTSVTIPDSVTTIGSSAFDSCSSLTSITIPDSITKIGILAFRDCDSLTSVTIPDSVTTIGNMAFYDCGSLTSVYCEATTPPSLGGSSVFKYNDSGRKIYVPAESVEAYRTAEYWSEYAYAIVAYDFENGVVVEPEVSINNVIHYTATAQVEANSYNPWSFVTFGANILSHDFNEESGEGVITFDADVTTIGSSAFDGCSSLTSITIPDSVTTIGDFAFWNCDSLTNITIPDSVTTIGGYVFCYCDSLTSVTIGDSVTTIGDYAFDGCESLTSVTIGDSVTTIGSYAFYECYRLKSVTIGDSVITIGMAAFEYCNSLTSITIPDSVTTIGYAAFAYCTNLVEFNGKFASEDGRCLIIDGTLNSFAPAGLTSYSIPDSVTTIGEGAFYDCDSLTNITIPNGVTTIGDYAFQYCSSLTSVTIPDSVTTIGYAPFLECISLTSVTIPDSVTTIGVAAFACCDCLTSVYCEATTPPSLGGSSVFDDNASGRTIYVPAASVEAYKTADYWSDYADAIVGYDFENGVVVE